MPDKSVITMGKKSRKKKMGNGQTHPHDYIYFIAKQIFSPLDCNSVHKYLMKMATKKALFLLFLSSCEWKITF